MGRGSLKDAVSVSAQKGIQGSEKETKELLVGTEEKIVFLNEGSLICPPGKSMFFRGKQEKLYHCSHLKTPDKDYLNFY